MISRRSFLKGLAASALPVTLLEALFGSHPAVAQSLPILPESLARGRRAAVIGAGVSGLTAAYELLKAGFDVTVFEGQNRYGGRSLTVRPADPDYRAWYLANSRFVKNDSYCDAVPAEVRGAKVPEQRADFVPVRDGDGFVDLFFNAGPGRIPTVHTGILHYCRSFDVPLIPYILTASSNLLHAEGLNDGEPIQFRQFDNNLRGQIASLLSDAAEAGETGLPRATEAKLREMLISFGDLEPDGAYVNSARAGYAIYPGAGTNSGLLHNPLPLDVVLGSEPLWFGLFARDHIDWQLPLLQPEGGMDMIWQAFLAQQVGGTELRDRVRLSHPVTGLRYAGDSDAEIAVTSDGPGGQETETFDYVVVAAAPFSLLDMDTADLFDASVRRNLTEVLYASSGKYGWQARDRFWEDPAVGIFGGVSWTDAQISQLWYPSFGYHGPTGILTGAYMVDHVLRDVDGGGFSMETGAPVSETPPLPDSETKARRWAQMNQAARTASALAGAEGLHPGFTDMVYNDRGLSVSWDNQPFQRGLGAFDMPYNRPDAYARLIRPLDRGRRIYLAGDGTSYVSGWQEGAVRSAWWALGQIGKHLVAEANR